MIDSSEKETTTEEKDKAARGEQTAENIRYGQAISEQGFGGTTVGNSGAADEVQEGGQTRREMGYGGGSGVGG